MRVFVRWSVVIALALMALAGCNSNDKVANKGNTQTPSRATTTARQPLPPAASDGARRITTVELDDALKKGEAVVVDVRNDAAYKLGHVKGAILIPVTEVAQHLSELPHDKLIVTYCS